MENNDLISRSECAKTKIKTHFAKIIVGGTAEKPYYEILYFDPDDKNYQIGFGSFFLGYVFQWLSEEFEIVDTPAVEAEPVRHGRWVRTEVDFWEGGMKTHRFACSECCFQKNTLTGNYCPNCGAKMDLEG